MPRLTLPCLAALCLLILSPLAGAPGFPQDQSDIAADPAVRFATLPNGVRSVVLTNHEPRDRASLRLLVAAGSFNESEDQRGLAHFLEHMAFKGSAHYPPGTLIEKLQRLGMRFGADTNASTSFDHTVFLLELPDTKPETLAEGLRIFADYAGSLLLQADQIESERGVILSEKRDRDSVAYRTYVAQVGFLLPDTRVAQRLPIGLADVIEKAGRDRFAAFYNTWYRPEKLSVVAVGDFDPAAVEAMIRDSLGSLKARSPAPRDPDLGRVASSEGIRTSFHPEPEAPLVHVDLEAVTPLKVEPDTAALRVRHLKRDLAVWMLNRRFEILSRKQDAPFTEASTSVEESYFLFREAGIRIGCKPESWTKALAVAEHELRRALTYGFQPAELKEVAANVRNELEQSAKGAATRRSNRLADELYEGLVEREVFTSPAQDLAFYGAALDRITPEDCAAALREAWAASGREILVSGNVELKEPDREIRAAYEASRAAAVEPPEGIASEFFPYSSFGIPGTVASRAEIPDLGITEITFSNGVRLNLKKTDFEAHKVRVSLRVGGGRLTEPASSQPGIARLADATFNAGGLGKLGIDELERVLAGRTVGFRFGVADDAFSLAGSTDAPDLALEFQLITAYLTDPGYRPEALWTARKGIPQAYRKLAHTPEGLIHTKIARILAGGDPRFGVPSEPELTARTLEEVKAWLSPQFASGPIEVGLAGDFDTAAAIDAVARTLGALPTRTAKPAYERERRLALPAEPVVKDYSVPTEIPKGLILEVWPTTDGRDAHTARRMGILSQVFADRLRLRIRNEMSGAYSPYASSSASTVFPGYGSISAYVTVDPALAGKISQAVLAIAGDLCRGGVTSDELERARKPALTEIRESARTNRYWLDSVLASAQEEPQRLEWARTRQADIEKITKAELDQLAARYLDPARASRFIILPEKSTP